MKKKLISAAVMLGVSGAATAVNVNPDGIGQVLLYPYYTVNGGKSTNIHVVNTTGDVKAIKVRFNEGGNTWEVLDFNVYLSPYDVWAGGLSKTKDGKTILYTPDTTCTVPKVPSFAEGGVALRTTNIDLYTDNEPPQYEVDHQARLAEGHVEIIEMGNIDELDLVTGGAELAAAATHTNGVPANCAALNAAWVNGTWAISNGANAMKAPSGGLFGSAEIFDVPNGISRGYNATAIDGFWDPVLTDARAPHEEPGNAYPNLNGQIFNGSNVLNLGSLTSYVVAPVEGGGQTVVESTWTNTVDALSASLMADRIHNEFYITDFSNSGTDWVITFPTKHFYVNPDTTAADGKSGQFALIPRGTPTGQGFVVPFAAGFFNEIGVTIFNREEGAEEAELDFSPSAGPGASTLAYEVNVLEFDDQVSVLMSSLSNNGFVDQTYDAGWASIDFGRTEENVMRDAAGMRYVGLPVLGFSATESQNGTLTGETGNTLGNYSAIFPHRYERLVTSSSSTLLDADIK